MPQKKPELDLDFNIYVDQSCLSEPMDEESPATLPPSPEEVQVLEPVTVPETPEAPAAEDAPRDEEQSTQGDASGAAEEAQEPAAQEVEVVPTVDDHAAEEQPEVEATELEPVAEEPQDSTEEATAVDEAATPETEDAPEVALAVEDVSVVDTPADDTPVDDTPAEDTTPEDTTTPEDITIPEPSSEAEPVPDTEAAPETEAASEPELVVEAVLEPEVENPASEDPASELEAEDAPAQVEETLADDAVAETDDQEQPTQQDEAEAPEVEHDVMPTTEEPDETPAEVEPQEVDDTAVEEPDLPQEAELEEAPREGGDIPDEGADAPPQDGDSDAEEDRGRPRHTVVDRKTSLRTEALIQAAARAVVAKIERRKSEDPAEEEEEEHDTSLLSTDSQDTYVLGDDAQSTHSGQQSPARRQSSESSQVRHIPSRSISSDGAGDSSSQHEADDDVFSDRSARSSVYSLDCHSPLDDEIKTPQGKETHSRRDSYASSSTTHHHHHSSSSPRAVSTFSNFSAISGLSQYDDKHHPFIPTTRDHRMPFRTPSEIRAMQMASPTPSVFNGSSPRSPGGKRHSGSGGLGHGLSRVGSPTVSAQYSPKGRSTPPRFKGTRKEEAAPLVLLHVTLLPLRWVWGEILNGLDSVQGKVGGDEAPLFEPSEQLKTLRDAWRELQDCVGDTVLERGILLPHPQNDYEVLEERLLEALELPVRRRARILECGHYLGPGNDMLGDGVEEEESEDEGEREGRRHWCVTCREEIRYEQLGPGKVFRVKVYASNGLMRAGAWEACWKEMERVDVDVEPIVESAVQGELEKLGALQLELEEQRRQELEMERTAELEAEMKRESAADQELRAPSRQQTDPVESDLAQMEAQIALLSSRPSSSMQLRLHASSPQPSASTTLVRAGTPTGYPADTSDDRRRRDEERLREIYGDAPAAAPVPAQLPAPPAPAPVEQQQQQLYHPQAVTTAIPPPMPMLTDGSSSLHHRHPHQHPDPYNNPHAPQEDPYNHTQPRAQQPQNQRPGPKIVLDENSGFVELLMEAFKVLLRDPKNVAIIVLCVFLVVLMRTPGMGFVQQQQEKGMQAVPPPPAAEPVYRYEGEAQGGVPRVQVERVVAGEVKEVPAVDVEAAVAQALVRAGLPSPQLPSVEEKVGVEDMVSAPEAEVTGEVEEVVVVEEPEPEALLETEEAEAFPVVEEVSETEIAAGEAPTLQTDICAPRGLEYPMTMADEVPVLEIEEAEDEPSAVGLEDEIEQVAIEDSNLAADEAEEAASSDTVEDTEIDMPASDAADKASAAEECTASAPASDDDEAEVDADSSPEEATGLCKTDINDDNNDYDSEADDEPLHSASASTLDFTPGPFVTERKTVRVFETVTETVRVSVVTQTETVSHVVTAVPQTLEETVYETETVRITVSVPVEERKKAKAQAQQAQAAKGCKDKRKKGWF